MARLQTIAVIVLAVSLFLLFDKLFTPQPIQITLETGQEVATQSPNYFSLPIVLLLVVCAFLVGGAAIYLYYTAELQPRARSSLEKTYVPVMDLLKPDERRVVELLLQAKGGVLQSALSENLSVSKVKTTRLLARLGQKGVVRKERSGFTNRVFLVQKEN